MKNVIILILALSLFSCKKIETPAVEKSDLKVTTIDLPNIEPSQGIYEAVMAGPDDPVSTNKPLPPQPTAPGGPSSGGTAAPSPSGGSGTAPSGGGSSGQSVGN